MIQKFLAKYILEVIPSIVATVIGAYIVTHYINAKQDDKPVAAASAPAVPVKAAQTSKAEPVRLEPAKSEPVRAEPETAKIETPKSEAIGETEKSGEKSAQAARVLRNHQIAVKERAAKAAAAEKAATAAPAPEVRDANDIARAAIERLRGAEPRAAETKAPERKAVSTVGYAPPNAAPVQTYTPPPVQAPPVAAYVPPPAREASIPAQVPAINSPNVNSPAMAPLPSETVAPLPMPPPPSPSMPVARFEDPSRPTPPADIPPLDIRARDNGKQNASVAEDVVSAAKNAFQSVMPR